MLGPYNLHLYDHEVYSAYFATSVLANVDGWLILTAELLSTWVFNVSSMVDVFHRALACGANIFTYYARSCICIHLFALIRALCYYIPVLFFPGPHQLPGYC